MKLLKLHIDQNVNSKLIKIKENSTKNSKTPIKRNSVSPRLKRTFNIHSTIAQPLISHKKSLSSIYEPKCKESRKKINLNLSIDDSLSEINAVETPSTEKDDSVVNSNFLDESLSSYYTQDTFLQSSYSSTTPIQFLFSYEKHGYSSRVSPIE